ncbi:MAG: KamA family radical SAM protein [bacterium]
MRSEKVQVKSEAWDQVHTRYPVKLCAYVREQIRKYPAGALAQQALPSLEELLDEPGMVADPFAEQTKAACCYGVKQRFPNRVLVMTSDQCAMNCRHCTRKGLLHHAEVIRTVKQLMVAVAYVKKHPLVREVLLSGGDPLMLSDVKLMTFVKSFASLPQIDAVRIGTRMPAVNPVRVTAALAKKLGDCKKVWVNTQFNHVSELTPEAVIACGRLVDAGIPVSNQSVLLKGVNDSVDAMVMLCSALQRVRVRPYYVFQCDPVAGIAHFRVPLAKARRLARELPKHLGGLALPRFVRDIPGALCKQEL